MFKQLVKVWDKEHEVSVYQKSKPVWIAVVEYMRAAGGSRSKR
jgi:hypothetical protein